LVTNVGCLDDLGNSIYLSWSSLITYTPFTQDNHPLHSKFSLAMYINKYNYYLLVLSPSINPNCIHPPFFVTVYSHIYQNIVTIIIPKTAKQYIDNIIYIIYTLIICIFYILLYYICTVQGILNKNVIVIIATSPQYYYICFTIYTVYMMLVIIIKIKYHPLFLIIATNTRYFLWCPRILYVHVIIIISEDKPSDKYHMFNLL